MLQGSLSGAAGILLVKLISLFYIVPLNAFMGPAVSAGYAAARNIGLVLAEVCCAGIPYTVITMTAARKEKEDWRTILLIRKLSLSLLIAFGFIAANILILNARPLAGLILSSEAAAEDIDMLQKMLSFMSIVIFISPWIIDLCCFFHGLSNDHTAGNAVWINWIARFGFLVVFGLGAAYGMHASNTIIGYIGILSFGAGCCATLYYLVTADRRKYQRMHELACEQEIPAENINALNRELLSLCTVFVLSAVFGNAGSIMDSLFFISALEKSGAAYDTARNLYSLLEWNGNLFVYALQTAAVMILNLFIGKISHDYAEKDMDAFCLTVEAWLNTAMYYLLPAAFTLGVLIQPIFYILFGSLNASGSTMLIWTVGAGMISAAALCGWILLIRLKQYSEAATYAVIGGIVKAAAFFPFINWMGASGAPASSVLASAVIIFLSFSKISNLSDISYARVFINFLRITAACLAMNGAYALLRTFVFDLTDASRWVAFGQLLLMCACGKAVYLFIMNLMGLRKKVRSYRKNISSKEESL